MIKKIDKKDIRRGRHQRIRNKVNGTAERPRLCVFRSARHIYAQIIDDVEGATLVSASTLDKEIAGKIEGTKCDAAKTVGEEIAKRAQDKGITEVVFDRGGFLYTGRVAKLAEGARDAGLKF